MSTRDEFNKLLKDMLIGPYPLTSFSQKNGEEILFKDSPLNTYISGVLFPQHMSEEQIEKKADTMVEESTDSEIDSKTLSFTGKELGGDDTPESELDTETFNINSFKQSGMGITICVSNGAELLLTFSGALYEEKEEKVPVDKRQDDGTFKVEMSSLPQKCYYRIPVTGTVLLTKNNLPDLSTRYRKYSICNESGEEIKGIILCCTYRMALVDSNACIYTFTVMNSFNASIKTRSSDNCWWSLRCPGPLRFRPRGDPPGRSGWPPDPAGPARRPADAPGSAPSQCPNPRASGQRSLWTPPPA